MADENVTPNEAPNQEAAAAANEAPATEAAKAEQMIPKNRFDEINSKYKEVQTKLDELLSERSTAETSAKEQQGKFEELYKTANGDLTKTKGEHKAATERAAQLEAVITGLLETKLEAVPKEFRDLVPANMPPEARLDWLNAAEKKGLFGAKESKRETPIGKATNPGQTQSVDLNKMSPSEIMRAAYGAK